MKIQVFDKFFTEFEINQGYKNSYLMKTINCGAFKTVMKIFQYDENSALL